MSDSKPSSSSGVLQLPAIQPNTDAIKAFPKLLAATEDDRFNGHHSYELVQAMSHHNDRMSAIEKEYAKLHATDQTYNGQNSGDVATAFNEYASKHHGEPLPKNFVLPASAALTTAAVAAAGGSTAGTASVDATTVSYASASAATTATYSWAALLHSMGWARILYTIVWMVMGLLLLFFGYASLFWLHKVSMAKGQGQSQSVGAGLAQALPGIKKKGNRRSNGSSKSRRNVLSGGIGGLLIGFLFFSYLAAVINNAVSVDEHRKPLSGPAFFAVWLAPGLLGAVLGGYFAIASHIMAGILGATCLTIILTAVFSIRTLLIRIILISIFCVLLTAPLVQKRAKVVQMLMLNACTSLIGMVTFLNGVALVAPSIQPSSAWLDLWTLLFMRDDADTTTREEITSAWSSSVFKGYIAGAVLGVVVGFVFELVLHRRCGHDPEAEWNQYLGTYTQHMESGGAGMSTAPYDDPNDGKAARAGLLSAQSAAAAARAGLFEPAPSAWQRMVDFFDSDTARPAHYGNLSGDGTIVGSNGGGGDRITLRSTSLREKMRMQKGMRKAGPARFEALRKQDHDDDDDAEDDDFDDASSADEDDEKHNIDGGGADDDTEVGSEYGDRTKKISSPTFPQDLVPSLSKDAAAPSTANYGGYALPLPRPPFTTMTSSSSGASSKSSQSASSKVLQGDSRLTGTTVAGASLSPSSSSSNGANGNGSGLTAVHRPVDKYHESSPSSNSSNSNNTAFTAQSAASVPATPSLINAISRIQLAQQQARAWQSQQKEHGTPYSSETISHAHSGSPTKTKR